MIPLRALLYVTFVLRFFLTIFKVFIEFFIILLLFWIFGHKACGVLVPQPGIEPVSPAMEGRFLITGLSRGPFIHFKCLFIYLWLCWVFAAARASPLVGTRGGYSLVSVLGLFIASLLVARRLSCSGSRALEQKLNSCGTQAWLLLGIWDRPR